MPNHKACICIVIFALLIIFSPVETYAADSMSADFTPAGNLDITIPQSLHDFPIAPDAVFDPFLKVADGEHFMFSYASNYSMDDLFNMYAQYMKNSKDFIADKGDGTGTLYGVGGIKGGYQIGISIGLSIDNIVTVGIEPERK
ncbi:hypothetical protein SOV_45610 [Sporomusa ovata DSM 2662]|uniref:Uncharacterized protein n=1 Tax=Sporomusa ovata TaxID=2378 RepID=A0A0U1KVW7_9FIRM|nr:hypothetical protein [Sporomusa ovata]EQB26949.1 hypothetical protein SOV_3c08230 [Sporomusa ovata DSM 2662]CQR71053.1 hypothetical protein SpAn4DRAFT_2031 [Sporomusa ovata]